LAICTEKQKDVGKIWLFAFWDGWGGDGSGVLARGNGGRKKANIKTRNKKKKRTFF